MPLSQSIKDHATYKNGHFVDHVITDDGKGYPRILMESGVIEELIRKELLLDSHMLDDPSYGSGRVTFRQQLVKISYPPEWTSALQARTALVVLEVQSILNRRGFGLIDCHPFNFVIHEGKPKLVDIGSIKNKTHHKDLMFPELEFIQTYMIPLALRRNGKAYLALMISGLERHEMLPISEVSWYAPWPLKSLSFVPKTMGKRVLLQVIAPHLKVNPNALGDDRRLVKFRNVANLLLAWPTGRRIRRYRRRLNKYLGKQHRKNVGYWTKYEATIMEDESRLHHVSEMISSLDPCSVLDIGGNSGYLGERVNSLSRKTVDYTVADLDEGALERGEANENRSRLRFLVLDFYNPWLSYNTAPIAKRINSDVVVMLALSHHLSLTQGMSFECIWSRVAEFTTQFAIIEFMPLGLWIPGQEPRTPDWYSLRNFVAAMEPQFELVSTTKIEENRIVVLAKKLDIG